MKRVMLLVFIGVCLLLLGAGEYKQLKTGDLSVPDTVSGAISDSGDTAKIYRLDPKVALDSYDYVCTTTAPTLGGDSIFDFSWTAPVQSMILTIVIYQASFDYFLYGQIHILADTQYTWYRIHISACCFYQIHQAAYRHHNICIPGYLSQIIIKV